MSQTETFCRVFGACHHAAERLLWADSHTMFWLVVISVLIPSIGWSQEAEFQAARRKMVDEEIIAAGVTDKRVVEAMLLTPRHEFVSAKHQPHAYFDMALPIGSNQTISSPFIVAFMTASLDPQLTDRVLEIGTGSGYQAAVLSPLVDQVYTIEIVDSLGLRAAKQLKRLGYTNVHVKVGDGFQGWPEHAPFDKIIVTCSPEDVPQPLIEQLKEGGRMVIPVGERYQQTLYLFTKKEGKLEKESLLPTIFVPMTGKAESEREVQPDPKNPVAINGDFETPGTDADKMPGWYYGRQVELMEDATAPRGKQVAVFRNETEGRGSHLLQGFAIDGREVHRLEVSAYVKCDQVRRADDDRRPSVVVTFYDREREEINQQWLGPWEGTIAWEHFEKTLRVPPNAREGILRIGLFGATGSVTFDDVRIGRR